jgi:hypothetical protein
LQYAAPRQAAVASALALLQQEGALLQQEETLLQQEGALDIERFVTWHSHTQ